MKTRIRTYPIKGLMIFLIITFIVSLAAVIYFIIAQDDPIVIRVLVWIFCGAFSIISLIVMSDQLFNYVEVRDDKLISHKFLTKKVINIKNIQRIKSEENIFNVYVDNMKVVSFYSYSKESQEIIVYLDKHHVHIEW